MKPPVLVIAGVTASGKTALGIELCREFSGEVVSADSMQIYRGMDIATAAPTRSERAAAVHHLVGELSPDTDFSVADFADRARRVIADIHARGRLPVVVGGTGLYIRALLDNVCYDAFDGDPAQRAALEEELRERGAGALYEELCARDPALGARLHPNNTGRLLRALEVCRTTGEPMSAHQSRAVSAGPCYEPCMLALGFLDRARMWERMDARVDRMLENGLVEEARRFYQSFPGKTAAAAIGYKELRPYLDGEEPLEEAVARLKLRTRQYAKRQMTWFRRDARCRWIWVDQFSCFEELCAHARSLVHQSGIVWL